MATPDMRDIRSVVVAVNNDLPEYLKPYNRGNISGNLYALALPEQVLQRVLHEPTIRVFFE